MQQLIYCYDAWCGWCYGFGPVIRKLNEVYKRQINIEVLSGGMILPDSPKHIALTAQYSAASYKQVEERTGVKFGSDYLWHILNPGDSDWYPDSRKSAIALCIFKELFPSLQVVFAGELQKALFQEGRDLCDNEAYRHLLNLYHIDANDFYKKLSSAEYAEKASYEFALVKQLHVTGFPVLLFQESALKFNLVNRGYASFEIVNERLKHILAESNQS